MSDPPARKRGSGTSALRAAGPTAGVALAYLAAGEVAGLLAIPPGYASPIWPAAGIAVVAVLLFGRQAGIGIFAGSFLVNLHIALRVGGGLSASLLVALAVGTGASAQALYAAWLTRRFLGPGNPIARGVSAPAFLLLAGPVACLLNAAWSLVWLLATRYVHAEHALPNVLTWWVGDSIGVMLVAPLLLAWVARTPAYGPRQWAGLLVPLGLGLLALVALFFAARRRADAEIDAKFADSARIVADNLTRDLERSVAKAETTARAFGALSAIDRSAFGAILRPWLHVTPGVEAFEWVPYVPQDGLAAFEAASRDAEFPDYHVNPHGPDTPAGAPPPPFHAPILYVEPMQEERDAVGYDLATSPERLRALEEARDTGAVVSTRGIRLVLHPDEWGMLVLAAAYGGVEPPASLAERRKAIRGFVATVIRIDGLVADALAQAGHPEMVVRVSELSEAGERLLSGPAEPPEAGPDAPRWTSVYTVGGQTLRLEFLPSLVIAQSWAGWMVLAGALAATGLLVSIVLDTRAQAVRVERIVQARTAELAQSNEALARSSLELQRVAYVASHDLREPLRTITAFGEMLERDAAHLDPCARDHLRRITRAARRMQALVSELLAFVRVERGVERFVAVPMGEPVHVALDDLSALVEHSGAEVHVGRLPYALCDRVQMVLLFTNLFSNALKFRRPGVVPQIVVDGGVSGADCEIRVRDNGLGIPARDRERIFELFQRLHADDAYPGRGIGLAMCRRIVERHGGRIWVESEPGVGSVFHVVLPAAGAS